MSYSQKIHVDFNRTLCGDFLGMNAVYHGNTYMPEYAMRGYTEADRAVEYARLHEARLRIARTMFTPMLNCRSLDGPIDMHCQRMEAIRLWCQDMKEQGIEVALQAGWHFSTNTYWGHEGPDPKTDPDRFADWAAASFSYLMDECGLDNIKYVFLFTEPTSYQSGLLPEGYDLWSYYVPMVRAIDRKFREAGLRDRLKFVGPNNTSGGVHLAEAVRDLNDVIDIYSGHDYNYAHQGQWANMAQKMAEIVAPTGKPFWMDEYGMQLEVFRSAPQYGTYIAGIIAASMAAGHQTTLIWTLLDQVHTDNSYPMEIPDGVTDLVPHYNNRDSFHDGSHRWGLASFPCDGFEGAGGLYPAWYAYCLLSKAVGGTMDGGKVRSVYTDHMTDALTLYSMAVQQGEDRTFVAVNSDAAPAEFTVDGLPDGVYFRHTFAPFANRPGYGTLDTPVRVRCENGMIHDTLPAGGVVAYYTRVAL